MTALRALDLCAGAGGLSLGFKRAGWDVLGVERDGDAWHTHRENVGPCRLADMREFRPTESFDAVIGGVPCQGFSMAGKRAGSRLFRDLIRIGVEANARALILENVQGMVSWKDKNPDSPTFGKCMPEIIQSEMLTAGYVSVWRVLNCADYGTPQFRRRIIFAGFRDTEILARFSYPDPSHGPSGNRPHVTMRQALGLEEGSYPTPTLDRPSPCVTATEGRSAQNFGSHGGKTKPRHAIERIRSALDEPARTVTNGGTQTGGAEPFANAQYRKSLAVQLGPTEIAILQGFPEWFEFHGNLTAQYRQIGNAVPPQLGEAVGRSLMFALTCGKCSDCGEYGNVGRCPICGGNC